MDGFCRVGFFVCEWVLVFLGCFSPTKKFASAESRAGRGRNTTHTTTQYQGLSAAGYLPLFGPPSNGRKRKRSMQMDVAVKPVIGFLAWPSQVIAAQLLHPLTS